MASQKKKSGRKGIGHFRRSYEATLREDDDVDNRINSLHLIVSPRNAVYLKNPDDDNTFICAIRVKRDTVAPEPPNSQMLSPTSETSSQTSGSTASTRPALATSVVQSDDIIVCVWAQDSPTLLTPPPKYRTSPSLSIDGDSEDEDAIDGFEEDSSIVLQCTSRFLSHYNVAVTDTFYIRGIEMFPLTKAIFSISSEDAYTWLQQDTFSQGLLEEICNHNLLVRQNDVLLAPYPRLFLEDENFRPSWYFHIKAISCVPFQIGLMTQTTEIIIFYEKALTHLPSDHRHLSGNHLDNYVDLMQSKFLLSDFCRTQSIENDNESSLFTNTESLLTSDIFPSSALVIQQVIHWRKVLLKDEDFETLDLTSVLGMPKKLMRKHGILNGAIVKIVLYPKELLEEVNVDDAKTYIKQANLRHKFVKVHSLSRRLDDTDRVFISSMLLFNLQESPPVNRSPLLIIEKPTIPRMDSETDIDVKPKTSHSLTVTIPVASEMQFMIISSPCYTLRANHTQSLNKYFQIPRLLSIGDVFAVSSIDDPEFWQESKEDTSVRKPVIFFKVSSMKPRQPDMFACYVDVHNTSLLQVGSDHSYVPLSASKYLSYHDAVYGQSIMCPGLNKTVVSLEHLILPFLSKRNDGFAFTELIPSMLLAGPRGCGKRTVVNTVARRLYMHLMEVNCHDLMGDTSAVSESRIKNLFLSANKYSPCVLLMRNIEVIGKERDGKTEDPRTVAVFSRCVHQLASQPQAFPVIVVATTSSPSNVSDDMLPCFLHEVTIEAPTEQDRADIIHGLLESYAVSPDVSISHLAQRTAGFVLSDLTALVIQAKRQAYHKALKICHPDGTAPSLQEEEDLVTAGVVIEQTDLESALDFMQSAHSDSIGAPKIPSVKWSDIGGLEDIKAEILDTVQLPLQHPELLAAGLRRSGVLLYGPPGTGKTLLAKAVATECSLNFLSVKGPELINMYVGQSEENVREVFKRARSANPCVIFFDELDSLAPNRGKSGDSGGVMDRVVSQLLAELDGLHQSLDVFVIGATNRPDLLDPALLRPGRFDKLLYLGVSKDTESQLSILRALTKKFNLAPDVSLEAVAERCPRNLTGADLYALCADAMLCAIRRKIAAFESGECVKDEPVEVTEEDFNEALENLVPSVSEEELDKYEQIQAAWKN
ncbi:unnamed protein product [Candidula unifasciata]|uniref:Peroxisomal ATPase PEX6 n=1 Tax=Candidula unifasciata TaxID=100452 RepID=A0A8S3ZCH6_9EUPU|nr:unnamed protein product [Candidula unifasciata]